MAPDRSTLGSGGRRIVTGKRFERLLGHQRPSDPPPAPQGTSGPVFWLACIPHIFFSVSSVSQTFFFVYHVCIPIFFLVYRADFCLRWEGMHSQWFDSWEAII